MWQVELVADTNVVSYIFRARSLGATYTELIGKRRTGVTLLTLAELRSGVEAGTWPRDRVQRLDTLLRDFVALPATSEIADVCGALLGRCLQIGRAMTWPDAWAAATALWLDVPLVTHDRDLEGIPGLRVLTAHGEWRVGEEVFGGYASRPLWTGDGPARFGAAAMN